MTMTKLLITLSILFSITAQAAHVKAKGLDLTTNKVAYIVGRIEEDTVARFSRQVLSTANIPGDRIVFIDSPGGFSAPGEKMYSYLKLEQEAGNRLVCVVLGSADSMAFNLLTRCDVRLTVYDTTSLVHKLRYYILPQCVSGCTSKVLQSLARGLDRDDDTYRRANARAMRLSLPAYDKFADGETMWQADELIRRGYYQGYAEVER